MSGVIFSKSSGFNNAAFGKIETPIKTVILSESDIWKDRKTILTSLFNVEKSNRFGETITSQTEFGEFIAAGEGQGAPNDSVQDGLKKFIEHVQFMKEFVVTAEMAEDSTTGITAEAKRRSTSFVAAYEKTKVSIAEKALANATNASMIANNATIDLTAPDGQPLFSSGHRYAKAENSSLTQSNYYYGGNFTGSTADLELALTLLASKLRSFKDENLDPLGYVADTIILPGNRPLLEAKMRKVVGSERTPGTNDNDINIQYGNWSIVVLPKWETTKDEFMIMSSDANEQLCGNMFFNRVPLTVTPWEDNHTSNLIWTGRTRFGIGFGSWKHILRAVSADTEVSGATPLSEFPVTAAAAAE